MDYLLVVLSLVLVFSFGESSTSSGESSTSSGYDCISSFSFTFLGQGSFGIVYEAHRQGSSDKFALKLAKPLQAFPESISAAESAFENELNVLRSLQEKVTDAKQRRWLALLSPEFPQPLLFTREQVSSLDLLPSQYQNSEQQGLLFPFYAGGNLQSFLEQEPDLSQSEICYLALGIVQALQTLHSAGYVHLDLKPDNILLDTSLPIPDSDIGQPVLADFGLTKKIGIDSSYGGSVGYVAPEIDPLTLNQYSGTEDVFSFGSILKQLQSMRSLAPCDLIDEQTKLWKMRRPDRDLVSRCWRLNPTQRPTLAEIKQELQLELCQAKEDLRRVKLVPSRIDKASRMRKFWRHRMC